MSDMKVEVRVAAKLDPSYQSTLERAERAAESYGREVGQITKAHDGIEVEIQRLLDHLRCDQHLASAVVASAVVGRAVLAERPHDLPLPFQAIRQRKPGVKDERIETASRQLCMSVECVIHGVADIQDRLARIRRSRDFVQRLFRRAEESHRKGARPSGSTRYARRSTRAGRADGGQRVVHAEIVFFGFDPEPLGEGVRQTFADGQRQRRGQKARRASESRLELQQPFHLALHVGVVRMHLVENEYPPHEAQEP